MDSNFPKIPGSYDSFDDPPPKYDTVMASTQIVKTNPIRRQPISPNHRFVAVMGATGSGKSTFISQLAGRDVGIGHQLSSRCVHPSPLIVRSHLTAKAGTSEIKEIRCRIGSQTVCVLDTPGFNDTDQVERKDIDILRALADWLSDAAGADVRLSGIVYLHDIGEARITGTSVANLRMFRALCGDDNLRNVVLTTSKWEITPRADAESRERQLKDPKGFWGVYIACKARVRRFYRDDAGSAAGIVDEILRAGGDGFTPLMQEEMSGGKSLGDTQAGLVLQDQIARMKAEHESEKAAIREEYENARRQLDSANMVMFQELFEKVSGQIEEQERAQARLKETEKQTYERRILELERRASQGHDEKSHVNRRRIFHKRFRCLLCRQEKTDAIGMWRCPNCRLLHENVEDGD